jgi:hypothetical protein
VVEVRGCFWKHAMAARTLETQKWCGIVARELSALSRLSCLLLRLWNILEEQHLLGGMHTSVSVATDVT